MAFGAASMAADLPKEGKYKGTASGYGTSKSIPVGKERVLTSQIAKKWAFIKRVDIQGTQGGVGAGIYLD